MLPWSARRRTPKPLVPVRLMVPEPRSCRALPPAPAPFAMLPVMLVVPEPRTSNVRLVPSFERLTLLRVNVAPPLSALIIWRLPPQLTVRPLKLKEFVPAKVAWSPLKMSPPVASVPVKVWAWLARSTPPLNWMRFEAPKAVALSRISVPWVRTVSPV